MKKGDFIKVKKGTTDPDYPENKIDYWAGRIKEVKSDENEQNPILMIEWDIQTLRKVPRETIKHSLENDLIFSEMLLYQKDIGINFKPKKWDEKQRLQFIEREKIKYGYLEELDEEETIIADILESRLIEVNKKNLAKYKQVLEEHLVKPVYMTGIEDFRWEEKYLFGYGEEGEYEEMKKENPSYEDEFLLLEILPAHTFPQDLVVRVKRTSDKKEFHIPLSELEAIEENSINHSILEGFASWIVNYVSSNWFQRI